MVTLSMIIMKKYTESKNRWENPNQCLRPPRHSTFSSVHRGFYSAFLCGKQLICWFTFFFSAATSHYTFCAYSVKYSIFRASQVALAVKNLPANAGDLRDSGWIPGSGGTPGEENSNSCQYFCLENSMDRGAWWAAVYGVAKSRS